MTYSALAWKNLVRRPVRTALTAGGVALAVAVAVSLGGFNLGYRQAIAGIWPAGRAASLRPVEAIRSGD